jgi:hypothetical protein
VVLAFMPPKKGKARLQHTRNEGFFEDSFPTSILASLQRLSSIFFK